MALSDRTPGVRRALTVGRRLDMIWRYAFPGVTSVFLMVLSLARFGLWEQAALLPAVALICVWFWSLYRPAAMSPPVVLGLGVLLDVLGFLPLGVGGLTMLTAHGIALRLRGFLIRHGFALDWLIFSLVASGIAAMNWALVSLLTLSLPNPGPLIFHAGLAVALYPAVAIPLALAHRSFADPDRA